MRLRVRPRFRPREASGEDRSLHRDLANVSVSANISSLVVRKRTLDIGMPARVRTAVTSVGKRKQSARVEGRQRAAAIRNVVAVIGPSARSTQGGAVGAERVEERGRYGEGEHHKRDVAVGSPEQPERHETRGGARDRIRDGEASVVRPARTVSPALQDDAPQADARRERHRVKELAVDAQQQSWRRPILEDRVELEPPLRVNGWRDRGGILYGPPSLAP